MVLQFVFPALILAVILTRAYTEVDEAFVQEWAKAHALTLSERNRPMVRWYLHTARVLRTWGAVAGLVLPPLIGAAFGSSALKDNLFFLVFVGYLAGAVYAEVALVRAPTGSRRVAALVPRELADYLPRRVLLAQRWLPVVVVLAAGVAWALGYSERATGFSSHQTPALAILSTAIVGALIPRVERWLIERPQPFTDPDLIAADDALRSQSVHSVGGSGLAIQLLILASALVLLAMTDVQILRWTMWMPAIACLWGSIGACLYYGHRAWRVRRPATLLTPS